MSDPNKNSVDYRVKTIIVENLGTTGSKVEELKPETTFQELGYDSLDAVEVVMLLEEEFDIVMPDEDADSIDTVGQMISYVTRRLSG
jgi:acyl carrier protein